MRILSFLIVFIYTLLVNCFPAWAADTDTRGQAAINQAMQQLQSFQNSASIFQKSQVPTTKPNTNAINPIQTSTTTTSTTTTSGPNSNSGTGTLSAPATLTPTPAPGANVAQTTNTTTTTTTLANNPQVNAETTEDAAFNMVTSRLFPLTPEQIVQLREMYNVNQLAQVTSPTTPPRPTATSQFVNLSTGSTPPVIRLAQGFVSSLVFLDSTGAPWPITAYDLGDPHSFNIQWDRSGNTLMIQASQLYNYGNLAVRLQGLNTPVMLTLIPGQKAVDYRVDLRVQGYGPNAKIPSGPNLPASADSVLLNVLDGVPPPGSKLLDVSGGEADAWMQGNKLYVRTRLTILSPGWVSFMSSADGMNAYEMQRAPILLVSWHGKVMQLKVEGL